MNISAGRLKSRVCQHRLIGIICFLGLTLYAPNCLAQEQWDAYQPRKLSEIIELNQSALVEPNSRVHFLFTADSFPSRVKVVYTGKSRAISKENAEVVSAWAKVRQVDKKIVDLFEREILFTENSVEHWLPIQKQLIPFLEQEVKVGDPVELFVIWIGARKEGKREDWVFLINEFSRLVTPL